LSSPDLCSAIECLLFVSNDPASEERLAEVLGVASQRIPQLIEQLQQRLEERGLYVVELAGGYSLATRPQYADFVQRLVEPSPEHLSVAALETLAIIAYRQPITRPEIDEFRGVNSWAAANTLLDNGLIEIAGRRDAPGRPFLLRTTQHFLNSFGLRGIDELPQLDQLQAGKLAEGLAASVEQQSLQVGEEDQPSPTGDE